MGVRGAKYPTEVRRPHRRGVVDIVDHLDGLREENGTGDKFRSSQCMLTEHAGRHRRCYDAVTSEMRSAAA